MTLNKTLLSISVVLAGGAWASPYTGNDAQSNAMGNTGVASANSVAAGSYNPSLLATFSEDEDFGLSLLNLKIYIDDSEGFLDAADDFIEDDGTWDKFQNVNSVALKASVDAIPATIANINTDIANINAAATSIETATSQTDLDSAVAALNTATTSLSNNASTLDSNVVTVDTEINNIDITVNSADEDLNGLSGKPFQFGSGVDWLKVAMPDNSLGWGVTLSTNVLASAKLTVSQDDLTPITNLSGDLTGYTTEVSNLSAAVSALAAANAALTEHLSNAPALADPGYAAWETELTNRQNAVSTAADNVRTSQTAVEEYDGDNGTITNGEIDLTITDDPQSEIEVVGVSIAELGVPIARQFNYRGQSFAAGITPKFQVFNVFEKTIILGEASDESDKLSEDPFGYFEENSTTLYRGNLDIGASKTWDYHGQVKAGVAVKDIIPWNLETDSGTELKIRPKLRIAASHTTKFTKLAVDLDVTENKPLKYGVPTRYFGIGGEINAWGHAALRAGYRNNLSVDDSHVISTGIGLTPFGAGLDLSTWLKPSFDTSTEFLQDFGVALQLAVSF